MKQALRSPVMTSDQPRKRFVGADHAEASGSPVGFIQAQLEAILLDESRGYWSPLARASFVLLTCGGFWATVLWLIFAR